MRLFTFVAAIAVACLMITSVASASSIAINFGADEPNPGDPVISSAVSGPAGVLGTANWNNVETATGMATGLVDGGGAATAASVEWASNNTWASTGRSEENNTAPPGDDRNLMTGYLDTNADDSSSVIVSGLSAKFPDGYNVYVYIKGGVIGRGGEYTIGANTQPHVDTGPFTGNYVFGSDGDVLVFPGVFGDSFELISLPTTGGTRRAPVNGIEISETLVPEPSSMVLIGLGVVLAVGGIARRRRCL